jgi:hypothetical protein
MRTIAASFGDSIPVVRGDGEYGIVSTTRSAVVDRESEQRALAAEFSTVSGVINPGARPDPEVLKRLWNNMVLYDEHT